ncbi:uncharacterized protein LOC108716097 [Xenopus laevis]|uniref:CUB domain-containing protein n=2 Tax=Xenopus laevis TaxID=8355 RepID=A0A974E1B3_XENLA|nr:uncharacterized protein LOC108716097 [Xenopus laevis]OCU01940.1 hypothetical protein XELAEV_18007719mg [Xenopus laevis]
MGTVSASWILVAALLLWNGKLHESKVYYMCGTVLDSTEKGLILSPGFPNHYLSGSHCVWQFFIPAGSQLLVETLDFDIFESTSNDFLMPSSSSDSKTPNSNQKRRNGGLFTTETSLTSEFPKATTPNVNEVNNHISISRKRWDKTNKGENQLSNLQGLKKEQGLDHAGTSTSQKAPVESNRFDEQDSTKPVDLIAPFTAGVVESLDYWQPPSEDATSLSLYMDNDSTSQPLVQDICPHDVLYISDLVTFSSRFCGSNSPLNKTLVFGSPVEMMEVIMELITTTDRGRGFAILFTYQNQTLVTSMGIQNRQGGDGMMLLAVTAAAILFAFVLLMALCLSYRQKMCPKRDPEAEQSTQQSSGSQNVALEASELQLVVPSAAVKQWELEAASPEEAADTSHQTLQVDSSSSAATVTDSHSDEVFVISTSSNTQQFTFTSFPLEERSLRRSVTSPASVSDWVNPDYSSVDLEEEDNRSKNKEMGPTRQRTWSVRTFNSLLPPITQLQMKWRARTSSGSFTKLVDNGVNVTPKYPPQENSRRACSAAQMDGTTSRLYSESSASNASYPLTRSAQLQRKLPSCNLKRSRPSIGLLNDSSDCLPSSTTRNPCIWENNNLYQKSALEFSALPRSATANSIRSKELSVDLEMPKTVFAICEEADDKQPLVFDDQLSPSQDCLPPEKEVKSITCTVDVHSFEPSESLHEVGSSMKSADCTRYLYTDDTPALGSFTNPNIPCVANTAKQDSVLDANSCHR